jgi:hypothetical protein
MLSACSHRVPPLAAGADAVDVDRLEVVVGDYRELLTGEVRRFRGLRLADVLQQQGWTRSSSVALRCADGYRSEVGRAAVDRWHPILAFAFADGAAFSVAPPDRPPVGLGPYYLVWPAPADVPPSAFAYQVVGLAEKESSPLLHPPGPPSVVAGAAAFRRHCSTCHAVAGVGGRVGPELHAPRPIATWVAERWLRQWMLDPTSMRRGTPMPGLPDDLPHRERVARQITRYLTYLAERGGSLGSAGPGTRPSVVPP